MRALRTGDDVIAGAVLPVSENAAHQAHHRALVAAITVQRDDEWFRFPAFGNVEVVVERELLDDSALDDFGHFISPWCFNPRLASSAKRTVEERAPMIHFEGGKVKSKHATLGCWSSTERVWAGIPRPMALIIDMGGEYPPIRARRRTNLT